MFLWEHITSSYHKEIHTILTLEHILI
jgi:hypothetical protein